MMKPLIKLAKLSLAIFAITMASCEKEVPLNEAVIGKWEVQSIRQTAYQGETKKFETTVYLEADELAVQFAADGAGIWYQNGGITGFFSWTMSGNTMTLEFSTSTEEWEFEVDGSTIIWSYSENQVIDEVPYRVEYTYTGKKVS